MKVSTTFDRRDYLVTKYMYITTQSLDHLDAEN